MKLPTTLNPSPIGGWAQILKPPRNPGRFKGTTHVTLVPGKDKTPSEAWRWAVIRYALDSTRRTVRLCVILLVLCVPAVLLLALPKG